MSNTYFGYNTLTEWFEREVRRFYPKLYLYNWDFLSDFFYQMIYTGKIESVDAKKYNAEDLKKLKEKFSEDEIKAIEKIMSFEHGVAFTSVYISILNKFAKGELIAEVIVSKKGIDIIEPVEDILWIKNEIVIDFKDSRCLFLTKDGMLRGKLIIKNNDNNKHNTKNKKKTFSAAKVKASMEDLIKKNPEPGCKAIIQAQIKEEFSLSNQVFQNIWNEVAPEKLRKAGRPSKHKHALD